MKQVRRPLVAALALFTAAITLDRASLGTGSDAIAWYGYLIALGGLALPLLTSAGRRTADWVNPAVTVSVLFAAWMVAGGGIFGGHQAHVAATEIGFVVLSGWLGTRLATGLTDIDGLLATAAFGDSPALDLEGPVAATEIHTELARGRRHHRPISVTVLTPTERGLEKALERASVEIDRTLKTRYVFGTLARTVAAQLRRSDLLFEHRPTGRLIILSPETDAPGLDPLIRRILDAAARAGVETATGSASFPEDGIGFETLVEHAEAAIHESEQPQLRAVPQGGVG